MKIISSITLLLTLSCLYAAAQGIDLNSHPKKDSIILEIAIQTVLIHGPDYYRDHQSPIIIRGNTNTYSQISPTTVEENPDRFFYIVKYPGNERDKSNLMENPVKVWIWENNGEAFLVEFDNGHGFALFQIPLEERYKYVMEYRDLPKPKPKEVIIYDYNGNIIERRMQEAK